MMYMTKLQPVTGARFTAKRVIEKGSPALATILEINTAMNLVKWVTDGGRKFTSDLKAIRKGNQRKTFAFEVKEYIEHPEL